MAQQSVIPKFKVPTYQVHHIQEDKYHHNAEHSCAYHNEKLYVLGPQTVLHVYDLIFQTWTTIPIPSLENNHRITMHQCQIVHDTLYIIGGEVDNGTDNDNHLRVLHLPSMTWQCEELGFTIGDCAFFARYDAQVQDMSLIVYGGFDTAVLSKMRQYHVHFKQWQDVLQENQIEQRTACAFVYHAPTDCLYVQGGSNNKALDDLVRFSFETSKWTTLAPSCGISSYSHIMTVMDANHVAIIAAKQLFVFDLQRQVLESQELATKDIIKSTYMAATMAGTRWICSFGTHVVTFFFAQSYGWTRALQSAAKCQFTDLRIHW